MTDAKLRKTDKVLSPRDYRTAYDHGKRFTSASFTAFVVKNSLGNCRLGITATRKMGTAVERNRAKRLMREVFRQTKEQINGGYDIIINVRRQLLLNGIGKLRLEFNELISRIGRQWVQS